MYEYHLYSPTADYGISPRFHHRDGLPNEGFASLYAVSVATAKAIEQAGTAAGFKGVVWSERLWLDFDSYEAAEEAETTLIRMGVDYVAFDTGGRGGHFGILRDHAASHLLPSLERQWTKEHFPKADLSIYTHLHPFRLPGTKHQRTGDRKRMVGKARGGTISLSPLKRENLQASKSGGNVQEEGYRNRSIFDCFGLMACTVPVGNGERHDMMVKLIYRLKQQAKVDISIAKWWVDEWNKMLMEPKSEEEIDKAIRSIYT